MVGFCTDDNGLSFSLLVVFQAGVARSHKTKLLCTRSDHTTAPLTYVHFIPCTGDPLMFDALQKWQQQHNVLPQTTKTHIYFYLTSGAAVKVVLPGSVTSCSASYYCLSAD